MTLLMVQILSYQGHREEGSLVTKASFVSLEGGNAQLLYTIPDIPGP